jgi:hypothetical protein
MRRVAISFAFGVLLIYSCTFSAVAQKWIKAPSSDNPEQRWRIYGEVDVEPGDAIRDPHSEIPICKDHRETSGDRSSFLVGQALQANIFDSLKAFATSGGFLSGSVVGTLETEVSKFNEQVAADPSKKEAARSGRDFAAFLKQIGVSRRYATCGIITLILPPGAIDISGPKYAVAEDDRKYRKCESNGQENGPVSCPAGKIEFSEYHEYHSSAYVFVVKNLSPNLTRHVRVSMLFTPPLNYVPPEDSAPPEKNSTSGN